MENNQQNKIDDVLEIVSYIKDNAASRADLSEVKGDLSDLGKKVGSIEAKMATKEDIGRLSLEIVNIKETMVTKDELHEIDEKFNKLIDSIDRLTKKVDDYLQETVSASRALKRHENWIQQLAAKLEIKLEY